MTAAIKSAVITPFGLKGIVSKKERQDLLRTAPKRSCDSVKLFVRASVICSV
jgi:hypothetical protein